MGKSNKKTKPSSALPLTPLLYINDPQLETPNIRAISAVIPSTKILSRNQPGLSTFYRGDAYKETVLIIAHNLSDDDTDDKLALASDYKAAAIKQGHNFASVNLYLHSGTPSNKFKECGTNHLDLNIALLSPEETADKVYKWLFTILSVPETLHLIPESEMLAVDTKHFPHYAYCPLSESRLRPCDAKIQFVALITSKAEIIPGKLNPKTGVVEGSRLSWTVIDRTGTATFYFSHRGPSSNATWDWVLSLKPGDRKALPRMPSVAVTETNGMRLLKSPFRFVGATVSGTGRAINGVGHGLSHIGKKLSLGRAREWVPEADVVFDNKGKAYKKDDKRVARGNAVCSKWDAGEMQKQCGNDRKRGVKVFDEKGRRLWGDEDSLASTEGGSIMEEKEFA